MIAQVRRTKSGNCGCSFCGKTQEGLAMHPITVYVRADGERRGHQMPVCSMSCAESYINKLIREE